MFSIITANWNGEKFLKVYLESLSIQTYKSFILYLVDNGSNDRSIEIINNYKNKINIKLIKLDKNLGFSHANNLGINEAMKDENEYIITLNNDIELDKNCLALVKERVKEINNKYDIFQILTLNYYERNKIDAAGISFNKYYGAKQIGHRISYEFINDFDNEIDGACAGAAVYSKKALKTIQINENEYFDSIYFAYFEDVDLAIRLLKNGYKSYLIKEAKAFHIHSGTSGKDSFFKSYYLSRNSYIYLTKNLSKELFNKNKKILFYKFIKRISKLLITANISAVHGTLKGYGDYRRLKKRGEI